MTDTTSYSSIFDADEEWSEDLHHRTMRRKILSLKEKSGASFTRVLRKSENHLLEYIMEQTADLPEETDLVERTYCAVYPENRPEICRYGNRRKFYTFVDGYQKGCGRRDRCQCLRDLHSEALKESHARKTVEEKADWLSKLMAANMENLGVPFASQSVVVKEKTASTNQSRYGGRTPMASKAVREKVNATNMKRRGVSHWSKTDSGRKLLSSLGMGAARKTFSDANDGLNPFQTESVRKKIVHTLRGVPVGR